MKDRNGERRHMVKQTESQTLDARFHHLSTGQRSAIARTLRREVEKYGGLPNITKRHKERVARTLAIKYGVPQAMIIDVYERAVTAKVERDRRDNEAKMAKLRAEGKTDYAFGKHVPDIRPGAKGISASTTRFGKKGKK